MKRDSSWKTFPQRKRFASDGVDEMSKEFIAFRCASHVTVYVFESKTCPPIWFRYRSLSRAFRHSTFQCLDPLWAAITEHLRQTSTLQDSNVTFASTTIDPSSYSMTERKTEVETHSHGMAQQLNDERVPNNRIPKSIFSLPNRQQRTRMEAIFVFSNFFTFFFLIFWGTMWNEFRFLLVRVGAVDATYERYQINWTRKTNHEEVMPLTNHAHHQQLAQPIRWRMENIKSASIVGCWHWDAATFSWTCVSIERNV